MIPAGNREYVESLLHRYGFEKVRRRHNGFTCLCKFHEERNPSFSISDSGLWMCWSCFPPDAEVVMADGRPRKISEIRRGDRVLTEGGAEVVSTAMHRHYEGDLVSVRYAGMPYPILATTNHKFYVKRAETRHRDPSRIKFWRKKVDAEVTAENLSCSDYIKIPIYHGSGLKYLRHNEYRKRKNGFVPRALHVGKLSADIMRTFGLYIAEGNSEPRTMEFTLHSKERNLSDLICRVFKKWGMAPKTTVLLDKHTRKVRISSVECSFFFEELFGRGAENKRIPGELMECGDSLLSELFFGYLSGDGHQKSYKGKKTWTCVTVSRTLAFQLIAVGYRLGFFPTMSISRAKRSRGCNHKESYRLSFPTVSRHSRVEDGNVVARIRGIKRVKYSGPVFNLTVPPTHKYNVYGALVSNCGVKGNLRQLVEKLGGNPDDMGEALKIMGASLNPGKFMANSVRKSRMGMPSDFKTYAELGKVPLPILNRLEYDTIAHFQLGQSSAYKMDGRCVIPIIYKGKNIGYHGRAIEPNIEPKYYNSPGFDIKEHVFNYDGCEPGEELIIVEGAFNAMSMWEKGFGNVVATFGTKFTSDQLKKIFALSPESIVICFDRDVNALRSGQRAAMALGELTHQFIDTYIMPLPKGKDPNQLSEDTLVSCYDKRIKYDDIRQ